MPLRLRYESTLKKSELVVYQAILLIPNSTVPEITNFVRPYIEIHSDVSEYVRRLRKKGLIKVAPA